MIDADVRNVKRIHNGAFTGSTRAQESVVSLCNCCARQADCKMHKKIKLRRAKAIIVECRDYEYPIMFRDTTGTEDCFNTMRMGRAWFNRLKVLDTVGLLNDDGNVFATAIVIRKLCLPKEQAMLYHAHENHLLLGKESDQATAQVMAKILRNNYGNLVFNNSREITVIYLQRDA